MGPATCGAFCNQVQSQTHQICFTGTGSNSLGSRRPESALGESGCLHLSLLGHIISKVRDQGCHRMILIAAGWSNMPWFWDLVSSIGSDPFQAPSTKDLVTQPFDRFLHRDLRNLNLHAWLLEPLPFRNKGSLKKWQQELKLITDSQPEPFTNQWAVFVQWCKLNKVDFRSPPVTPIADFLLHPFKDGKLQPSTFVGYRTVFADMVGQNTIAYQ